MTLREWCRREGHPLATLIYVRSSHPISPTLSPAGKACVCGLRCEQTPDARRALRVLDPYAVDAEGLDRCEPG